VFNVILFEPQIPANTGNVIRLCANTGASLHLIRPLGFDLDDSRLRRAGLDYREYASVQVHDTLAACLEGLAPGRLFACSTRGRRRYSEVRYRPGDAFVFGPETRGLPAAVLAQCGKERVLRLPMRPDSRSLNLSNAVAVMVYEAWRQSGYDGALDP